MKKFTAITFLFLAYFTINLSFSSDQSLYKSDKFIDDTANGIVKLKINFDNGLQVGGVGFLISLPDELKSLEGRVVLTCGHILNASELSTKCELSVDSSQAYAQIQTSFLQDYAIHDQYFDDSNYVDLGLILLKDKLKDEAVIRLNYKESIFPETSETIRATWISWGPASCEQAFAEWKKRKVVLNVITDKDDYTHSYIYSDKFERSLTDKGNTYYSVYYRRNIENIDQNLQKEIKEKSVGLSPLFALSGDSGSCLLVDKDIAVLTTTEDELLQDKTDKSQELTFKSVSPYIPWIIKTIRQWEA